MGHQACCLLYYLGEINNGIHINQFTFEHFTLLFPDVVVAWFQILTKNIGESTDLAKIKKGHGSAYLYTPIHPPPSPLPILTVVILKMTYRTWRFRTQRRVTKIDVVTAKDDTTAMTRELSFKVTLLDVSAKQQTIILCHSVSHFLREFT